MIDTPLAENVYFKVLWTLGPAFHVRPHFGTVKRQQTGDTREGFTF
jgi:hypothetical protein